MAWVLWAQDVSRAWPVLGAWGLLVFCRIIVRHRLQVTWLDTALVAFLLTALVGVWAAYDRHGQWSGFVDPRPAGWQALWGICLSIVTYYCLSGLESRVQVRWACASLGWLGAFLALWFVLTHDWANEPVKWALATQVGVQIQARVPGLPGPRLHPNILSGTIAPLLPLGIGAAADGYLGGNRARWLWVVLGLVTGIGTLFGLALAATRGAWLALAAAGGVGALWWALGRRGSSDQGWMPWAVLGGAGLLVGVAALLLVPRLGSETVAQRLDLLSESLLLVRDYPFTGLGLGMFGAVHSTYVLMIHVPVQSHAHVTLLDVALEQGVLGGLAALTVLGGAAVLGLRAFVGGGKERAGRDARGPKDVPARMKVLLLAGLFSLLTMALHGLVDDPFYSSRAVWLLWAPAGVVVAAAGQEARASWRLGQTRTWNRRILLAIALVALVLSVVLFKPALELLYANLGAVYQTRAELRAYDVRHVTRTLDEVRQTVDLSSAETWWGRALASFSDQRTARTRLAGIELSLNGYDQALVHTRATWNAGHRDRVTRLLWADALVANGDPGQAAEVVYGLSWAAERLAAQASERYGANGDDVRAASAWRAVALLDPDHPSAAQRASEAEERARNE